MSVHSHDVKTQSSGTSVPVKPSLKSAPKSSRKRKRVEKDAEDSKSAEQPFSIKPHPSSIYDKPCILTPMQLVPRSNLSLSYLDPAAALPSAPTARLFSANIALLEQKNSGQDLGESYLLICRTADGSLVAIERVQTFVYALCKLRKDVAITDLANPRPPKKHKRDVAANEASNSRTDGVWWDNLAISNALPLSSKESRYEMPRLRMSLGAEKPSAPTSVAEPIQPTKIEDEIAPEAIAQPTALDIFQVLVGQYLEALYLSRTSLAYFAKGPLSRARAAFTATPDENMQLYDLVAFLRTMILSQSSIDKKYRETLPEIAKSLDPTDFSEDNGMVAPLKNPLSKRKMKAKKLVVGRSGVYSFEKDYVKRWVFSDASADSAEGPSLRNRISELRIRETLAQITLMLEILALEASPSFQTPTITPDENDPPPTSGVSEAKPKKRKPKTPQDLKLLIDLHLDKLCIWQSVEQDDIIAQKGKADHLKASSGGVDKDGNGGRLKEFCIEVIIPFYLSRTPECATLINRKLGAPTALSPPKRSTNSSRKATEALAKGSSSRKSRRAAAAEVSETVELGSKPIPALTRSSTDSAIIPYIKREPSEAPTSVFAPQRSSTGSSSAALSQYKRFSQREVDLNTGLSQTNVKLRKKQSVQEELKNAISMLKKPNRSVAVREFVDSVDQRLQMSGGRLKKTNSLGRKSVQPIQVTATPKKVRRPQDALHSTDHYEDFRDESINSLHPPSSISMIPSSAVRPAPGSTTSSAVQQTPMPRNKQLDMSFGAVEETPSRGIRRVVSFSGASSGTGGLAAADDGFPISTPLASKHGRDDIAVDMPAARKLFAASANGAQQASVMETPVRPRSTGPVRVASTPIAATAKGHDVPAISSRIGELTAASPVSAGAGRAMVDPGEDSIYDALGWNDDINDFA